MTLKSISKNLIQRLGYEFNRVRPLPDVQKFCDFRPDELYADRGRHPTNRVLVITQPKAGTYLMAEILKQAGLEHTYLHLGQHRLQAYEPRCLERGIEEPFLFDVRCPISESRNLIRFGQVGVSHIPFESHVSAMLSGFKIIHVKRELRSSLISRARMYLHSKSRGMRYKSAIETHGASGLIKLGGKNVISEALAINDWATQENVLSIKMEDMFARPERTIEAVIAHIKVPLEESALSVWQRATAAATLTKAEQFPTMDWTEDDEFLFRKIGGNKANRALGYE